MQNITNDKDATQAMDTMAAALAAELESLPEAARAKQLGSALLRIAPFSHQLPAAFLLHDTAWHHFAALLEKDADARVLVWLAQARNLLAVRAPDNARALLAAVGPEVERWGASSRRVMFAALAARAAAVLGDVDDAQTLMARAETLVSEDDPGFVTLELRLARGFVHLANGAGMEAARAFASLAHGADGFKPAELGAWYSAMAASAQAVAAAGDGLFDTACMLCDGAGEVFRAQNALREYFELLVMRVAFNLATGKAPDAEEIAGLKDAAEIWPDTFTAAGTILGTPHAATLGLPLGIQMMSQPLVAIFVDAVRMLVAGRDPVPDLRAASLRADPSTVMGVAFGKALSALATH